MDYATLQQIQALCLEWGNFVRYWALSTATKAVRQRLCNCAVGTAWEVVQVLYVSSVMMRLLGTFGGLVKELRAEKLLCPQSKIF